MPDHDQVNFRINSERKKKWEQYVDENPDFRYMSQLIRYAVKQEIDGKNQSTGTEGASGGIEDQLRDMKDVLGDMKDRNQRVESDVGDIKREVTKDPELVDLSNEVFGVLPSSKEDLLKELEVNRDDHEEHDLYQNLGLPNRIAEQLDEREYRIQQAIDKLQQDTYLVDSIMADNPYTGETEPHYYKND